MFTPFTVLAKSYTTACGFTPGSRPNKIAPVKKEKINRNKAVTTAKINTETYLDSKIVVRLIGLISSSFIVPQRCSLEMIFAATIIVNKLISDKSTSVQIGRAHV